MWSFVKIGVDDRKSYRSTWNQQHKESRDYSEVSLRFQKPRLMLMSFVGNRLEAYKLYLAHKVLDSENLDKPTCLGRETYDEAIWETCWVMESTLQLVLLFLTQ